MKNVGSFFVIITLIVLTNNMKGNSLFISDKTKTKPMSKKEQHLEKIKELDKYYSDKRLGSFIEDGKTIFRIFTPTAEKVTLVTFKKVEDENGIEYEMKRDANGVWEASIDGENYGLFYGYKVIHKNDEEDEDVLCVDPYAKAVASLNTYFNPRKSIVIKEDDYDWEGDSWIQRDWRDLIIYEMHVRDMTADPSSGDKKFRFLSRPN